MPRSREKIYLKTFFSLFTPKLPPSGVKYHAIYNFLSPNSTYQILLLFKVLEKKMLTGDAQRVTDDDGRHNNSDSGDLKN